MSTATCPYCDRPLSPADRDGGWCDACGKKLPSGMTTPSSTAYRGIPGVQDEPPPRPNFAGYRGGSTDEDWPDVPRIRRMPLASLGARFGGSLLDGLAAIVFLVPGYALLLGADQNQDAMLLAVAVLALGGISLFAIQVSLITMYGQSIGKKMVGTRIVSFEDGSTAGFVRGFLLRSVVPGMIGAIPYVGGCFSLVDVLCIFGEQRRCLHDQIAGTSVVDA